MEDRYLIGYARVSTDDQDLKLQRDALIRYGVPERRIFEEKISGATTQRKNFQIFLKALRPGDALVVWKLDRMGRTLTGVLEALEYLAEKDVKFISLTDGFDTDTPMGKAMLQIALVFAELERNLISERTKAGMAAAKKAGKTFGRKPLIVGYPKRVALLRRLDREGKLRLPDGVMLMNDAAILDALNKVKDCPEITNVATVRRWRYDGLPGLLAPESEDDE